VTRLLAAIDASAAAAPVLAAARALATFYDADVEAIHVREGDETIARAAAERASVPLRTFEGAPLEMILSAAQEDDVAALVLGARAFPVGDRPVGHVTSKVATSLRKPVVVVPRHAASLGRIERVLVPLEGTARTSAPMAGLIERARAHGLDVIALHIRDERSVPRFSEESHHEMEAWSDEFLARHCRCPPHEVRLEVRVGSAGEQIVRAVEETGGDLVALSWSQSPAPDRARIVRECLDRGTVPILLLPYA
jgi:nucleotide-binding universal stress UspA family protein